MSDSTETSRARAVAMFSQGRPELAEPHVRQVLAGEPDDGWAHAALAMCLGARREHQQAIAQVGQAVAAAPDNPFVHYVKSIVLSGAGKHQPSLASIREALKLDPEDPDYHAHHAAVLLDCDQPREALAAADRALALNARHGEALNMRTHALMQLGRFDGAQASLAQSLAENPENDVTHTAAGMYHLQTGDSEKATEHFLQALRLDPNDQNAKLGLLTALKARHRIYRVVLWFFLWLGRQPTIIRWGVIIGLLLLNGACRDLARHYPALAPLLAPIAAVVTVGFLVLLLANPIFNLLLRLHPLGRHLIPERQRAVQNAWMAALMIFFAPLGIGLASGSDRIFGWAFSILMLLLPLGVALAHNGRRRRKYLHWTAALAVAGGGAALISEFAPDRPREGVILLLVYLIGCILVPASRFIFKEEQVPA